MVRRLAALLLALLLPGAAMSAQPKTIAEPPDPYLWLEDVDGARAMDWVRGQNATSLARLQADPHYPPFYDTALELAQAADRIPLPHLIGGQVYNLWQDATHVQGIWRRTSLADYRNAAPHWTTVLDLDALSRAEGRRWVFRGADCLQPDDRQCLISLSDGGEDATTQREFDLRTMHFVAGGFVLPRAKTTSAWEDENALLVATDWGAGTMTASGYPFIVKRLRRGQTLERAREIYRGTAADMDVGPARLVDGQGNHALLIYRRLDFFHVEHRALRGDTPVALRLPAKLSLAGLVHNRLILVLDEAFGALPSGSLAARAGPAGKTRPQGQPDIAAGP